MTREELEAFILALRKPYNEMGKLFARWDKAHDPVIPGAPPTGEPEEPELPPPNEHGFLVSLSSGGAQYDAELPRVQAEVVRTRAGYWRKSFAKVHHAHVFVFERLDSAAEVDLVRVVLVNGGQDDWDGALEWFGVWEAGNAGCGYEIGNPDRGCHWLRPGRPHTRLFRPDGSPVQDSDFPDLGLDVPDFYDGLIASEFTKHFEDVGPWRYSGDPKSYAHGGAWLGYYPGWLASKPAGMRLVNEHFESTAERQVCAVLDDLGEHVKVGPPGLNGGGQWRYKDDRGWYQSQPGNVVDGMTAPPPSDCADAIEQSVWREHDWAHGQRAVWAAKILAPYDPGAAMYLDWNYDYAMGSVGIQATIQQATATPGEGFERAGREMAHIMALGAFLGRDEYSWRAFCEYSRMPNTHHFGYWDGSSYDTIWGIIRRKEENGEYPPEEVAAFAGGSTRLTQAFEAQLFCIAMKRWGFDDLAGPFGLLLGRDPLAYINTALDNVRPGVYHRIGSPRTWYTGASTGLYSGAWPDAASILQASGSVGLSTSPMSQHPRGMWEGAL